MGLVTIDPNSQKVQTEFYKIPKFGVNRPNSKQDTAIWKCKNLERKYGHPDAVSLMLNFRLLRQMYDVMDITVMWSTFNWYIKHSLPLWKNAFQDQQQNEVINFEVGKL